MFGLTQLFVMFYSLKVKKLVLLRNDQPNLEYQRIQYAERPKCNYQCMIQNLNVKNSDYVENKYRDRNR